jgi:hypothetical protein
MKATSSAEPLLSLLVDVVQQTQTLRHEVSGLDLPPSAATYFDRALTDIEQRAAKFIAFCLDGERDH